MTCCVPTVINLFGPVDGGAALTSTVPSVFDWPGSCDTAHIAVFQSGLGMPTLARAIWRMCIQQAAGRALYRLVTCLDGMSGLNPIAYIDSANKPAGINVWNTGALVTDPLNAFFAANCNTPECNVGWQVCGDNTNPFTVYACRLELTWSVG